MQPNRKSQRKKDYDYSQPGYYSVTICTQPNHLHGIIIICVGALSLSDVIERFKSLTTKRYIDGVHNNGWHLFPGKLWQRSFHDRIIRNEKELNKIRQYICNNPIEWDMDENNIDLK